jgi:hypothetical protein
MDVHWLRFVVPFITALIAGGFGLALVGTADVNQFRARRSRGWAVTDAVILRSTLKRHVLAGSERASQVYYEPEIHYQYQVAGRIYQGKRIFFGSAQIDPEAALSVLSKYPPGTSAVIHFNPNKPSQSVLETLAPAARSMRNLGLGSLSVGLTASLILGLIVIFSIG